MKRNLLLIITLLAAAACRQETQTATGTDGTEAPAAPPATAATTTTGAPETVLSEGFSTPESVLYDSAQDVYFVANINGSPLGKDDNGYISRVEAASLKVDAKWIDGARPEVELHAPKGMAIVGDELWVSDITVVRRFDRNSGAPKGSIAVPGATFLNDLASDGAAVYVSDTAMKMEGENFVPTGTDAVWEITGGAPKKHASGAGLNRPNGLAIAGGKLWMVTFGGNEVIVDPAKKEKVIQTPKGGLDGIVALPDGSFAVSSWDGKAIYRIAPDGTVSTAIENLNAPADLGYDTRRNRILVPLFMDNKVVIRDLQ